MLSEVAKYGTAFVKRAYGDWTGTQLNGWKQHLLENSIRPMQQFAYTKGKNTTDTALIIDTMYLLYSERFGFVLFLATAASRDWPPGFVSLVLSDNASVD